MFFSAVFGRPSGKSILLQSLSVLCMLLLAHTASAKVLYVVGASGLDTNDGLSWSAAKKTVQAAVTAATAMDQIWVAKGTYTEAITLTTGISVYGGFAGTELKLTDRNFTTNPTVLDGSTISLGSIVTISNGNASTALDGFLIRNDHGDYINFGAINVSGAATVANNIIQNNVASGIICFSGSPRLVNNQIVYNRGDAIYCSGSAYVSGNLLAWNYNGGVFCDNKGAPTIVGNRILGNGYDRGLVGALNCTASSPLVKNNVIAWNYGSDGFGGIYLNRSSAIVTNNTIVYNSSGSMGAGAITLDNSNNTNTNYSPVIANNIIADNSAGLLLTKSAVNRVVPVLSHNCFFGNSGFNISGLTASSTDQFTEPQLLDQQRGDYHLMVTSPCINAGDDTYAKSGDTDVDGDPRLTYTHVDIGADEFLAPRTVIPTRHVVYVSPTGNANNDGFTWTTAKNKVQDALNSAFAGDLVWVAAGTYTQQTLTLNAGVTLYGGFMGTETGAEQRNPTANLTVLNSSNSGLDVLDVLGGIVEGFTIQNGLVGIACSGFPVINLNTVTKNVRGIEVGSASFITNNLVINNAGTGIRCGGNSLRIIGNTISNNGVNGIEVGEGTVLISANTISGNGNTGIVCHFASPTITRNTISGNVDTLPGDGDPPTGGGAIYCDNSSPLIVSNVIVGNSAPDGGAIFLYLSSPRIANNTIVGNRSTGGRAGGISMITSCNPAIANNIIANNSGFGIWRQVTATNPSSPALSHNNVFNNTTNYVGLNAGGGDFSADPLFVKVTAGQYTSGNYHLSRPSPSINAGDNNAVPKTIPDRDGNARVVYSTVDVGAYEFEQRFDLNNDRQSDLLWQNQKSGAVACWLMNGLKLQSSATVASSVPTEWKIVTMADLNSDQNLDLLFQNQNTGAIAYWLLNGTALSGSGTIAASIPTEWKVVSAPDLNGDGKPDLLLQNQRTGDVYCWFLDGVTFLRASQLAAGVPLEWKIVGNADINGDGMPDLIWQNQKTGAVAVWFLNGVTVIGSGQIAASVPLEWKVMGTPDLNGDGKPDLLWANQRTGDTTYWLLDGTTLTGSGTIYSGVPLEWQLSGMR